MLQVLRLVVASVDLARNAPKWGYGLDDTVDSGQWIKRNRNRTRDKARLRMIFGTFAPCSQKRC